MLGVLTRDDLVRLDLLKPALDAEGHLMVAAALGISADAEASSVQVLRESGVAGFIIEASSLGKLEKLRAAIAALPARGRKPDERREAMIPAPAMAGHDHDDDDFDDD